MRNGFLVNGESARDLNKSTPIKHVGIKDDYNIQSEHLANSEIRYDKYMVDKREKQLLFAGTVVVGTALSVLMCHNVFFSLVLLLFYIKIQEIYAEYMLARRKRALAEQFKDFLFILSTSIGTGRGMRDAIGEAIPGIVGIYGENAILSRELKNMHKRMSIGNEEDAQLCLGFKPDADVEGGKTDAEGYYDIFKGMMKEFGFKYVVSTLRESLSATHNGWKALIYDGEEFYQSKRYDINPIIDRVGGGDSFSGGLIHGMLTYKDQAKALEFAVAASALKHTIPGDFNIVSVSEVESLAGGNANGRVQR